jgi:Arc/MetJ-type ribon-helix-helix transcriptional regulator
MTSRKVTVSIPEELAAQVQALVESHQAASFSGYVQEALQAYLERHVSLLAIREHTGGAPSPEWAAWADGVLGFGPRVPAPDEAEPGEADTTGEKAS